MIRHMMGRTSQCPLMMGVVGRIIVQITIIVLAVVLVRSGVPMVTHSFLVGLSFHY